MCIVVRTERRLLYETLPFPVELIVEIRQLSAKMEERNRRLFRRRMSDGR